LLALLKLRTTSFCNKARPGLPGPQEAIHNSLDSGYVLPVVSPLCFHAVLAAGQEGHGGLAAVIGQRPDQMPKLAQEAAVPVRGVRIFRVRAGVTPFAGFTRTHEQQPLKNALLPLQNSLGVHPAHPHPRQPVGGDLALDFNRQKVFR